MQQPRSMSRARPMTTHHMGTRIRKRRTGLKLSREQLVARMGALGFIVRATQVYRWEVEGAIPFADAVPYIERALDVAPGWVLYGPAVAKFNEAVLTYSKLIAVLDELGILDAERNALQTHLATQEAKGELVTEPYIEGFIGGLRASGNLMAAHAAAVTAGAKAVMEAEGRAALGPDGKRARKQSGEKRRA